MITRIYIAGPYTKGDVAVNVRNALRLADYISYRSAALIPYVPHLTHFWHMNFPRPYEFWLDYDLKWLSVCDLLIRIDGESHGADKEVEYAKTMLGIPCHTFRGFEVGELNALDAWIAEHANGGESE